MKAMVLNKLCRLPENRSPLELAAAIPIQPEIQEFELKEANQALN